MGFLKWCTSPILGTWLSVGILQRPYFSQASMLAARGSPKQWKRKPFALLWIWNSMIVFWSGNAVQGVELSHIFCQASMEKSEEDMQEFIDQQLKQLEELKQEKLNLDTAREEFDRSRKHLDDADAAWTATCFALATEFLGFTRQIMDSLERLVANDLPPEEAAELKLFRMVNVCVRKRAEGGETSSLALDLLKQVMAAMKTGPDLTCQQKAPLSQSEARGRRRCQQTASQTGSAAGMAAVPVCVSGMGGRRR
ncbi:unnamed protein product [Symbiodinium sp. CCMP2456]|nr:unnamed protein product [Symbiodinium sp. CCMP2456]